MNHKVIIALLIISLIGLVVRAAVWEEECNGDVVFVMDVSSSIYQAHFRQQKDFVRSLITRFNVGKDKTRVGIVNFSDDARMVFPLNKFSEKKAMLELIDRMPQKGGNTNTGEAMRTVRTQAMTQEYGARLDDPSVPEIVIVITDGNSQDKDSTTHESDLLRQTGVTVFAIGVGKDVNQSELETIASGEDYIFKVDSFDALAGIRDGLGKQVCRVKPIARKPTIIKECGNETMDMVIAFDTSSNASEEDFHEMKSLAREMLYSFNIDQDFTRAAVLSYADRTKILNNFNGFYPRHKVINKINGIRQTPGKSIAAGAFKAMRKVFDPKNGARNGVSKVALFITNTASADFDEEVEEAKILYRMFGVDIFAVTVGEMVATREWEQITGRKVVHRDSYDGLPNLELINEVADSICAAEPSMQLETVTDIPDRCDEWKSTDIALALDIKNTNENFRNSILSCMKIFTRKFTIGPKTTRVSVVSEPCETRCEERVNFGLGAYGNGKAVEAAMETSSESSTTKILNKLVDETFTKAKGARDSSEAKRFAVLVTDGSPRNVKEVNLAAEKAKREGIEIFVVGIGSNVRKSSLQGIASTKDDVYIVDHFENSEGNGKVCRQIIESICKMKSNDQFEKQLRQL